ncbi:MAG: amaB [Herminiimonas sp.]|nr:amaB [Herminiimonas sp.]
MIDLDFPALNAQRLWARVEQLSAMTRSDLPWTRRAFSPHFMEARLWLSEQFKAAGLSVRQDSAGNLIGERAGQQPHRKPIATGSHCDTVVGGGRFDGIIGVLAGIEVAQTLHEQGIALQHPFEVIDFLSEEPSDYGISCIGSRGMCGLLDAPMLAATSADGETLTQGLARIGGDPDRLHEAVRRPGDIAAFIELHIEQGPVLELEKIAVGVVTNIVGIRRVLIVVTGRPDHAGTTPMNIRCDALVGAARVIDTVYQHAAAVSGNPDYVVATVGRISMSPNVPNAVPGMVEMMLEVRSDKRAILDEFPERVMAALRDDLNCLRLSATLTQVSSAAPTDCSALVMDAVQASAAALGYASRRLPSGAGHDAAYMAKLGPMGMIFIPCLNGRSHCAEEWTDPAQLLDGTRVLYQTVRSLDATLAETIFEPLKTVTEN